MRHNCVAKKFGRSSAHRKALMRNMVTNLVLNGTIRTTLPKAKQIRRDAEKMVTIARKGTLAARRACIAFLQQAKLVDEMRRPSTAAEARAVRREKDPVKKLFDVVVPALAGRACGFTRIVKLGFRRGDAAEMCLLQWVTEGVAAEPAAAPAEPAKEEAKK